MKKELLSLLVFLALIGILVLAVRTGLVNVVATGFSRWFVGLLVNH